MFTAPIHGLQVCLPEEELVVVLLVNQLTLECEAAKRLTAVVGESMGVDFGLLWADGAF